MKKRTDRFRDIPNRPHVQYDLYLHVPSYQIYAVRTEPGESEAEQ
jgi:hypothetical protein